LDRGNTVGGLPPPDHVIAYDREEFTRYGTPARR
jgi:hypothetical protein